MQGKQLPPFSDHMSIETVEFEVSYVSPAGSFLRTLQVSRGASVEDALALACVTCTEFPVEAWDDPAVAIHGWLVTDMAKRLVGGERLEILRPLVVDPGQVRRRRAANV